jgi:hypothetical protein
MRVILLSIAFLFLALSAQSQVLKSAGVWYFLDVDSMTARPAVLPNGTELAYVVGTKKIYYWNRGTSTWTEYGGGSGASFNRDSIYFDSSIAGSGTVGDPWRVDSTLFATITGVGDSIAAALGDYLPILGGRLTGTGGAGFVGFPSQSGAPSTPSNGFSLFGDNTGRFSWLQPDGYIRTLISSSTVADRGYRFMNRSYTLGDSADIANNITSIAANYIATSNGTNLIARNLFDNNTYVGVLNSKPFQFGQWTTAGRPSGTNGYTGFNTTTNFTEGYFTSQWENFITSTGATNGQVSVFSSAGKAYGTNNLLWDNTNGTLSVLQIGTAQQTNTITARGTGSSTAAWKGRIISGGDNAVFLLGEYNSQAWLGAHNGAVNAWADFYLNPDGAKKLFLGNIEAGSPTTRQPIVSIDNNGGDVIIRGYGSSTGWKGRTISGGASATVLIGEYNAKASIAGHNSNFSAWSDLFISFDGTSKTRIGKSDLLTLDNNNNRITYLGTAGSYNLDFTAATGAMGVPRGTVAQRPTIASSTTPFRYSTDSTALEYGESVGTWRQLATRVYARSLVPTTLYTGNGSLTSNRTLTGGAFDFRLDTDVTVGDSLRVVTLPNHTDPDSIATVKGGVIGKKKFLMPVSNIYDGTNSGYFFDTRRIGHQLSGSNFYHLDLADTSGTWEKTTYGVGTGDDEFASIYGKVDGYNTRTLMYISSLVTGSQLTMKINDGLVYRMTTSGDKFRVDTTGTIRAYNYGTGTKEAADLSKTQSNFVAGFATDGAILDLEQKRDTTIYVTDADYNFAAAITSANILKRYNRILIYSKLTSGASSDNQIILHSASSDFLQCEIIIYSNDASADADETSIDFTTNGAVDGAGGTVSTYGMSAGQRVNIRAVNDGGYKWIYN